MIEASLTNRAIEAAISVASGEGLRCDAPRVIGGNSNTLVHLHPHPVVARVATGTGLVREGPNWLAREVAITGFLSAGDIPAIRPSDLIHPGPTQSHGLWLSFWPLLSVEGTEPSLVAAGASLRRCHEALEGYTDELPRLGILEETRRLLFHPRVLAVVGGTEAEEMSRKAERIVAALEERAPALRPIHGDAHPGNFVSTRQGALWIDWEDTFLGPIEWDLACLVTRFRIAGDEEGEAEALRGYGAPHDEELLSWMIEARRLQREVWRALLSSPR